MSGQPVLLYDGDCGFCMACIRFAERRIGLRARPVPWQSADLAAFGTTRERAEREVLWAQDGRLYGGAQAVARVLTAAGRPWSLAGHALRVPPLRWIAHWGYRIVSVNRHRLPGGTPACALPAERR
ncbi:thiol-disulfide oxidoreductase DCC family protein [Streptosporangium saharense]|uniref:thiol-disulfide oxidoreductase DCC family protein n=1 Tax=Streptosporangium saharense TaxID=1706840 RepID=UPI0036762657